MRMPSRKRKLTNKELDWEIKERERVREQRRKWGEEHKEQIKAYAKKYNEENHDIIRQKWKEKYHSDENFRKEWAEKTRKNQHRKCKDPLTGDIVSYNCMCERIRKHREFYGDIKPCQTLIRE